MIAKSGDKFGAFQWGILRKENEMIENETRVRVRMCA
jgi:hypothetical protein